MTDQDINPLAGFVWPITPVPVFVFLLWFTVNLIEDDGPLVLLVFTVPLSLACVWFVAVGLIIQVEGRKTIRSARKNGDCVVLSPFIGKDFDVGFKDVTRIERYLPSGASLRLRFGLTFMDVTMHNWRIVLSGGKKLLMNGKYFDAEQLFANPE